MIKESLATIMESLKYLGFGEKVLQTEQLEEQLIKDLNDFQVFTETFYDDDYKLEVTLHFRRPDQDHSYYLNKYEALLRKGGEPELDRKQTFYIFKGSGVTLKEAYNLLQGRAVNKDLTNLEGEKYNAWIQLNFEETDLSHNYRIKQYRLQYGYDLEKVLEHYPIKELKNEEKKSWLIKALKRGNLQPVIFTKSDREEKMFIEANPQFKTINIYPSTRAAEKEIKKSYRVIKEDKPKPETPENAEEEATVFEEGVEEGTASPVNKPPVRKKGSANKIQ